MWQCIFLARSSLKSQLQYMIYILILIVLAFWWYPILYCISWACVFFRWAASNWCKYQQLQRKSICFEATRKLCIYTNFLHIYAQKTYKKLEREGEKFTTSIYRKLHCPSIHVTSVVTRLRSSLARGLHSTTAFGCRVFGFKAWKGATRHPVDLL